MPLALRNSKYIPEVEAWLAQCNGLPSDSYLANLTTMITTLVNSGDWQHIIKWFILSQEDTTWNNRRVSIRMPRTFPMSENGGITWDTIGGTGNGTTGYVDLNLAPYYNYIINGGVNSFGFGCYSLTNSTLDKNDIGATDTSYTPSATSLLWSKATDNKMYTAVNGNNSISSATTTNTDSLAMQSAQGKNGTVTGYRRGVSVGTNSATNYNLTKISLFGMANNNNGTANNFSTRKYTMFFIEDGNASHLNIYNAYQTFATAQGFAV